MVRITGYVDTNDSEKEKNMTTVKKMNRRPRITYLFTSSKSFTLKTSNFNILVSMFSIRLFSKKAEWLSYLKQKYSNKNESTSLSAEKVGVFWWKRQLVIYNKESLPILLATEGGETSKSLLTKSGSSEWARAAAPRRGWWWRSWRRGYPLRDTRTHPVK